MNKKFKRRTGPAASVILGLALLLGACAVETTPVNQPGEQPPPPQPFENLNPFIANINSEDGLSLELRGQARGHLPGKTSTFLLDIHNDTGETWQGRYCLLLVDQKGVVATFAQEDISLQPDAGLGTLLTAEFPVYLDEDAYGLFLIIPERFSSMTTIYVGENITAQGGPWPMVYCP
jgi:hypothetical protein